MNVDSQFPPGFLFLKGPKITAVARWPIAVAPITTAFTCDALIDTGAGHSALDVRISRRLGLTRTRSTPMLTPQGVSRTFVVIARIEFPSLGLPPLDGWELTEVDIAAQGIGILLGRDFLKRYRFLYDGPNGQIRLEW